MRRSFSDTESGPRGRDVDRSIWSEWETLDALDWGLIEEPVGVYMDEGAEEEARVWFRNEPDARFAGVNADL